MPSFEVARRVTAATDGTVGIDALEDAALAFARTAPAELVADAVESMIESLVDAVCGPCGMPIDVGSQHSRWSEASSAPSPRDLSALPQPLRCRVPSPRVEPEAGRYGLGTTSKRWRPWMRYTVKSESSVKIRRWPCSSANATRVASARSIAVSAYFSMS